MHTKCFVSIQKIDKNKDNEQNCKSLTTGYNDDYSAWTKNMLSSQHAWYQLEKYRWYHIDIMNCPQGCIVCLENDFTNGIKLTFMMRTWWNGKEKLLIYLALFKTFSAYFFTRYFLFTLLFISLSSVITQQEDMVSNIICFLWIER